MPSAPTRARCSILPAFALLLIGCSPSLESETETLPNAVADGILDPASEPPALYRGSGASPPLGGGGLAVSSDGLRALVSDPKNNQLLLVDLPKRGAVRRIDLALAGAAPGRPVAGPGGRFFVPLRGRGRIQIVEADGRRGPWGAVCAEPRGLALQPQGPLFVACANGDLIRLRADTLAVEQVSRLPIDDLRDVALVGTEIWVSSFRKATLLRVGLDGKSLAQLQPPGHVSSTGAPYQPHALWRLLPIGDKQALGIYQQHLSVMTVTRTSYYEGEPLPVLPFVTRVRADAADTGVSPGQAVLPIDMAKRGDDRAVLVIAAGNFAIPGTSPPMEAAFGNRAPLFLAPLASDGSITKFLPLTPMRSGGRAIKASAVAAYGPDQFLVEVRDPAGLLILSNQGTLVAEIPLESGREPLADPAHDLFHAGNARAMACASCHLEGGEDGHLWFTPGMVVRRTQSLRGLLAGKSRFHWAGEFQALEDLVMDDMTRARNPVTRDVAGRLGEWLQLQRAPWSPPVYRSDAAAADRGVVVFARYGCERCHSGPGLSSGAVAAIAGKQLVVPSLLGVGRRAPYFHDGRATSLQAAFADEKDSNHSVPDPAARDDLAAYLRTR